MTDPLKIIDDFSPNFNERPKGSPINALVLHYTGMPSAKESLARLKNPQAAVSSHYLIDEEGLIIRLVPEEKRAWHAGVSQWQEYQNLNHNSIGIELQNPGHEFGYRPFPESQINALIALCLDIFKRHPVLPSSLVIGHSDCAPDRKKDPGELFPWQKLAKEGIGLWPENSAGTQGIKEIILPDKKKLPTSGEISYYLAKIGYSNLSLSFGQNLTAFARHFAPEDLQDALAGCLTLSLYVRILQVFNIFVPNTASDRSF